MGLSATGPLLLGVLCAGIVAVSCERHSLTYIYTALSKQVDNPGIYEFTAMGQLDTKMIDYFNSDVQKKVPKQDWMKERLSDDYWDKGTQSRKSKQQWFKVNLDILKDRKNQTDDEIHVLQWMHGCEGETQDGTDKLKFVRGIDQYSYDGDSFLYFDDELSIWVAAATEAEPTKRKWDDVQVLKDYTKGYLERECLDWLEKFMDYGKQQLKHAAPPEVYLFASPARHKSSVRLNCLATGFYPPDIVINILRNGKVMDEELVSSTKIRPNEDDTYQRRDHIEILRTDESKYSCEFIHAATGVNIRRDWDGKFPKHDDEQGGPPFGMIVGAAIGVLMLTGLIVGAVLVKRHRDKKAAYAGLPTVSGNVKIDSCCVSANGSNSSGSSDDLEKQKLGNGHSNGVKKPSVDSTNEVEKGLLEKPEA